MTHNLFNFQAIQKYKPYYIKYHYEITFPLDLIPFARQAKTISQDNNKHNAKSHLISPMSPNVWNACFPGSL